MGAYALAAHGQPRATGDIDLWVRPTRENAERVMGGLEVFGAPLSHIDRKDFEKPDVVFQIGVSPHRIGILTSIEGVSLTPRGRRAHGLSGPFRGRGQHLTSAKPVSASSARVECR